ncbi:hypothetical protein [Kytococcus sedentarius]|uniref:hypothetical protein n=1 Tax=Kytococcus sedentarius TaxID=1276 RepID=UPI0035BBCCB1
MEPQHNSGEGCGTSVLLLIALAAPTLGVVLVARALGVPFVAPMTQVIPLLMLGLAGLALLSSAVGLALKVLAAAWGLGPRPTAAATAVVDGLLFWGGYQLLVDDPLAAGVMAVCTMLLWSAVKVWTDSLEQRLGEGR